MARPRGPAILRTKVLIACAALLAASCRPAAEGVVDGGDARLGLTDSTAVSPFGMRVPRVQLVRDLRIDGEKEDLSGFPFGFLLVFPNGGTMAFAEWQDFRIRFYDSTGRHIRNFGRQGGGPGEFGAVQWRGGSRANFSGGLVGDSVWTYDGAMSRRLMLISKDGKLVRTSLLGAYRPEIVLSNGDMLAKDHRTVPAVPRPRSEEAAVLRIDARGRLVRKLADYPATTSAPRVEIRSELGPPSSFAVPFYPRPLSAFSSNSDRFAFGESSPAADGSWIFRLTVFNGDGDTVLAREYPLPGHAITDGELERFINAGNADLRATTGAGERRAYSDAAIDELARKFRELAPRTAAPVGSIKIGIDNSVWLSATRDSLTTFLLLDDRGAPVNELVLAPPSRLWQVSRTHVWRIDFDDDGFPSILRYRIER